jgi:hypothetical protein
MYVDPTLRAHDRGATSNWFSGERFALRHQSVPIRVLGRATCVLVCLVVAAGLSGCGSPSKKRPKLSEAADQAKKKPQDQETLSRPTTEDEDETSDAAVVIEVSDTLVGEDADAAPASTSLEPADPAVPNEAIALVGLVVGTGAVSGVNVDGFGVFGVQLGSHVGSRARIDVQGLVLPVNLTEGSALVDALKDEVEFALDFSTRYYLTQQHTFLSAYPVGGFRVGYLNWTYENELTVEDEFGDPTTIRTDWLRFTAFYGGLGFRLANMRHMEIGANVTAGVKWYSDTTSEGFENDLFPRSGFYQLAFEACYRVGN